MDRQEIIYQLYHHYCVHPVLTSKEAEEMIDELKEYEKRSDTLN